MYNRVSIVPALIGFQKSLVGKVPYSEASPPGSFADGHLWVPGDPPPNHLDCSGNTHYCWYHLTGEELVNDGNALMQWDQYPHLRESVPAPADSLFFHAGEAVGHTGTCHTFDPKTGTGTYASAYDTAEGYVIKPFSIHVADYVGAVRIASLLPVPPAPPHTDPQRFVAGMTWTPNIPSVNTGKWLVFQGKKAGIPNPADFADVTAHHIPEHALNAAQLKALVTVQWGKL